MRLCGGSCPACGTLCEERQLYLDLALEALKNYRNAMLAIASGRTDTRQFAIETVDKERELYAHKKGRAKSRTRAAK